MKQYLRDIGIYLGFFFSFLFIIEVITFYTLIKILLMLIYNFEVLYVFRIYDFDEALVYFCLFVKFN